MNTANSGFGSRVSRREFLVAGGAGAAATLVGAAIPSPASAIEQWDYETDVAVIGSGGAGSVAALTAKTNGADVLIVEKAPVLGGTTAKSGGAFWIANNYRLKERGIPDPKLPFLQYCASYSFPHLFDPNSPTLGLNANSYALLSAFYDSGSEMTDLLRQTKALSLGRFHSMPENKATDLPDYGILDGYNKAPRGRCLGVLRPDGSLGYGAEMMRQFNLKFDSLGVKRLTNHRVTNLVMDGKGAVSGVEALVGERKVAVRARRGVIFGTGGFAYNRELLNRYHVAPVYGGCGVPTNTGDFVSIATAVGAQLGNMASAWRAQIVLEEAIQYVSVPSDVWIPPGDSMFLVNKYGKRAVNEKRNYHDRTRMSVAYNANLSEFSNQLMFMLYDQRNAELFAGLHPIPDLPDGSSAVLIGGTWDELADKIDKRLAELADRSGNVRLDPAFKSELAKTVARFNGFATTGKDEDFQRGDFPYDIETRPVYGLPKPGTRWGDQLGKNVVLYPMQPAGPYYAIILAPGVLDTNGGPVINANSQVVKYDGKPIPGLYGAGNCIASAGHDAYWAAGATLGNAMTFAYIAGKHAASVARAA
jgi:3-oxosteroid 1-dehydrogenase